MSTHTLVQGGASLLLLLLLPPSPLSSSLSRARSGDGKSSCARSTKVLLSDVAAPCPRRSSLLTEIPQPWPPRRLLSPPRMLPLGDPLSWLSRMPSSSAPSPVTPLASAFQTALHFSIIISLTSVPKFIPDFVYYRPRGVRMPHADAHTGHTGAFQRYAVQPPHTSCSLRRVICCP